MIASWCEVKMSKLQRISEALLQEADAILPILKKNPVYGGIVKTRADVIAVALRAGFDQLKGVSHGA